MRLEDFDKFNLPHYKHDVLSIELTVGEPIAEAWIASAANAWVRGYSKGGDNYHYSFQGGISQVENPFFPGSKNEPKDFYGVAVFGIVDEGEAHSLAYATSRNHKTKKIHTLRLTEIGQIIDMWDFKLLRG